jgi:hypothetical protein
MLLKSAEKEEIILDYENLGKEDEVCVVSVFRVKKSRDAKFRVSTNI